MVSPIGSSRLIFRVAIMQLRFEWTVIKFVQSKALCAAVSLDGGFLNSWKVNTQYGYEFINRPERNFCQIDSTKPFLSWESKIGSQLVRNFDQIRPNFHHLNTS